MAHKYIDKCVDKNYLPSELIYIVKPLNYEEVDLNRLQYNNLYHLPEFYEKRFPYKNLPGINEYIENIVNYKKENNITPLDEYNNIINEYKN